jgi:hypothetical protein
LWPPDDAALAHVLFTLWAARTGRVLRPVPVTELTQDELIDFWTDDQLDLSTRSHSPKAVIGCRPSIRVDHAT